MGKIVMTRHEVVYDGMYKGEPYLRNRLHFKKKVFFWWVKFSIIYDLTMFQNWKSYQDNWDNMISTQGKIDPSAIKERIIF